MNPPTLHVEELLAALTRKGIPLPFEMGAFLVLETTEQLLTRVGKAPMAQVSASTVWLNDDGELILAEAPRARDEAAACKALVELLGALLVRSAPGVPSMLLELVERGPSDDAWSLHRLRDDLEAALLPLNRSATRRVLSRMLREVRRDGERGARSPVPDSRSVDRDVDVLFGVQPTADSESEVPPPAEPSPSPQRGAAPRARAASATAVPRKAVREAFVEPDTLSGTPSPTGLLDDFEHEVDDGEGRTGVRVGLAFVVAAAVLVAAYFAFVRSGG